MSPAAQRLGWCGEWPRAGVDLLKEVCDITAEDARPLRRRVTGATLAPIDTERHWQQRPAEC
jgi:hypothetical protein